jgi:hypothetical protein
LHLQFDSHQDAFAAYDILRNVEELAAAGEPHWIKTKHYMWVKKQSETLSTISTPMLIDSFFKSGNRGTLRIAHSL